MPENNRLISNTKRLPQPANGRTPLRCNSLNLGSTQ